MRVYWGKVVVLCRRMFNWLKCFRVVFIVCFVVLCLFRLMVSSLVVFLFRWIVFRMVWLWLVVCVVSSILVFLVVKYLVMVWLMFWLVLVISVMWFFKCFMMGVLVVCLGNCGVGGCVV